MFSTLLLGFDTIPSLSIYYLIGICLFFLMSDIQISSLSIILLLHCLVFKVQPKNMSTKTILEI